MKENKLILLNGSSRKKGTSFSFARTMKQIAEEAGSQGEIIHIIDYFDGKKNIEELMGLFMESDTIGIIAPLYADSLPYHTIWFLEKLAEEHRDVLKGRKIFAIGQCGFPDITRNEPLLNACRFFAEETEMVWLGGLSYGGGPLINGAFLEDLGKKGERLTKGFKLALDKAQLGENIPMEAQKLITADLPKIAYWPVAIFLNRMIKKQAKENGNADYKKRAYLE